MSSASFEPYPCKSGYRRPTEADIALRRQRAAQGFRKTLGVGGLKATITARPWFDRTRGVWMLNLHTKRWAFALGVTRYRTGEGLAPHTDCDNPNWVAIFVLRRPRTGGGFHVEGPSIFRSSRLNIFRGDLYRHHVMPHQGDRWILMGQFALNPVNAA